MSTPKAGGLVIITQQVPGFDVGGLYPIAAVKMDGYLLKVGPAATAFIEGSKCIVATAEQIQQYIKEKLTNLKPNVVYETQLPTPLSFNPKGLSHVTNSTSEEPKRIKTRLELIDID